MEQPWQHLISVMLSGVQSQMADQALRRRPERATPQGRRNESGDRRRAGRRGPSGRAASGLPQLADRDRPHRLQQYGLAATTSTIWSSPAMNGEVVSEVLDGQRTFDLLVRLDEPFREDLDAVRRLRSTCPAAERHARIGRQHLRGLRPEHDPREQVRRRIVSAMQHGRTGTRRRRPRHPRPLRPLGARTARRLLRRIRRPIREPAVGIADDRRLFSISSAECSSFSTPCSEAACLALQVMIALPTAFIGSVAALYFTGQTLSIAAMVGFEAESIRGDGLSLSQLHQEGRLNRYESSG